MDLYQIKDGIIIRTDTGKKLRTMEDIAEHMNWLVRHNDYVARKDDDGVEYIDFVGTYADYYDLEELCELINCLEKDFFCNKQFEKHMRIKKSKERKHKAPFISDGRHTNRFVFDHTLRKGFWFEDWLNGKVYYTHIKEHRDAIVGLLNQYTKDERFVTYRSKAGEVIEDTIVGETYYLISSSDCCDIRDWLNWYDYLLFGRRKRLPYGRMLM